MGALFLKCKQLPKSVNKAKMHYTLKINDNDYYRVADDEFVTNKAWGKHKTITIQRLSQMECVKIKCMINYMKWYGYDTKEIQLSKKTENSNTGKNALVFD